MRSAKERASLDLRDPGGRLLAYVKLRASLGGHSRAWWYRGVQYAVVDLQPRRLWGIQGIQVCKFTARADGSFENHFRDLLFYQDLLTGEPLEVLRNPFTGRDIHLAPQQIGPMFLIYSRAGAAIKELENVPPDLETDWRVDRAIVNGDDLILHEEGYSRVTAGPERFVLNDFISFQCSASEASDPDRDAVPGRYNYCSFMNWPPFMDMSGHPGHLLGRGNGRKLESLAELEPAFLERVLATVPDWFDGVYFPGD